ncbi:hypothetical protein [Neorhizobium petrolearium]|uniref:hypothetical protein n=1 Tax=Neorhizobium petrolearium TaxID=515361 RepID=UPI003F187004
MDIIDRRYRNIRIFLINSNELGRRMIEISRRNGPLIASALLSVLDWNLLSSDVRFAGLDNYEAILASVDFRMASWNIYLWDWLVLEDKFKEILTSGIATFADLEGNRTRLGTADGDQPLVDRARPRHIPGRAAFHLDALAPGLDER